MGQFPDTLVIAPTGTEEKTWALVNPFRYITSNGLLTIFVPEGFTTDFASIPRLFWNILAPMGNYGEAAIIHDYLYSKGILPKSEADNIFLEGMETLGVGRIKRTIIYNAVKYFGFAAWNGHRKNDLNVV